MEEAWQLEHLNGGAWVFLRRAVSGDKAKTLARQHQRAQGRPGKYRILALDGSVWLYGAARETPNGFRMRWQYPPG